MNFLFLLEATTSDWLAEGFVALVAGMGTVFAILILISVVISLFKFMKTDESVKANNTPKVVSMAVTKPVEETVEAQDDLELIAVITAAIAASLETTTDQLQVKSFRRINKKSRYNR